MGLEWLRVQHHRRSAAGAETCLAQTWASSVGADVLILETCQRLLRVSCQPLGDELVEDEATRLELGVETYSGSEAYEFLLRFACGLESELKGETEVFGQLKDAWKRHQTDYSCSPLDVIFQRLFEDVKEIRTQHLQNLGSSSYGSRVYRILSDAAGALLPSGSIVVVGAGELTRSILPWLNRLAQKEGRELLVLNRSEGRLQALRNWVGDAFSFRTVLEKGDPAEAEIFSKAAVVIFCVPVDSEVDSQRLKNVSRLARVIHLGQLGELRGVDLPYFMSLQQFLKYHEGDDLIRDAQLARAARVCREKGLLRSLSPSTSLAHGWEDLAIFA